MKKILLLSFLATGYAIASHAQGWTIGDKVTIGHAWTVGNRPQDADRKFHLSFAAGRNAIYNFNDNVGLGFGTFFSSEGNTFEIDNDNAENTINRMRLNYIRIPVGFHFTFGDAQQRVRPRLGVGGAVGFLVGGKTYTEGKESEVFAGVKSTRIMSNMVDAGATASLGLNVRLADGFYINHDVNYYHGLVENEFDGNASPSFTNRNIGLSMGFLISGDAMRRWKSKMHDKDGMKHKRWDNQRNKRIMHH